MQLDATISKVATRWHIKVTKIRRDLEIAGSPERSELRFVIENEAQQLYLIESIFGEDVSQKQDIISLLRTLSDRGMSSVNPYLKTDSGDYIVSSDDRYWQISPFIKEVPLKRPGYVFDKWRGGEMARFLILMKDKTHSIPGFSKTTPFSIVEYVRIMANQIREHEPKILKQIDPVVKFLENEFMEVHNRLPISFCHGDFHPLNIIWSETSINKVIDWEFTGYKPESYDVANLISCVGVEQPESLLGPLILDFLSHLKQTQFMSTLSWSFLIEFIVAIRFAWLSEWLRHRDQEMISLEMDYMNLLVTHRASLKSHWDI